MRRASAAALLVLLVAAAWPGPAAARELWRSGEAYLDGSGTVRQIALTTRGTPVEAFRSGLTFPFCSGASPTFALCPAFAAIGSEQIGQSLTRLRLRLEARADSRWSAVVEFDNAIALGNLDTFEAQLGEDITTRTLVDATGAIGNDVVEYQYELYRGYVQFESRHFEAAVGRQRIPWGVGRLWNPIDRFNAIRPLAIQADQAPGVDAIDARALFTGFTQLQGVFAAGRTAAEHAYAARLQGVLFDVDYGLVAGVFDEAPMGGIDFATNLRDAAVRAEITFTHPTQRVWNIAAPLPTVPNDFWQVVVSLDYSFDWGTGLYFLVEHLYNGNALGFGAGLAGGLLPFFEQTLLPPFFDTTSAARFGGSRVVTRSSQLTGVQAGYDLTPELRLDMLVIYDWVGTSAVFFPTLRWSPRAWLDVTVGVQGTAGSRLSEYGDAPTTAFLLADLYF